MIVVILLSLKSILHSELSIFTYNKKHITCYSLDPVHVVTHSGINGGEVGGATYAGTTNPPRCCPPEYPPPSLLTHERSSTVPLTGSMANATHTNHGIFLEETAVCFTALFVADNWVVSLL